MIPVLFLWCERMSLKAIEKRISNTIQWHENNETVTEANEKLKQLILDALNETTLNSLKVPKLVFSFITYTNRQPPEIFLDVQWIEEYPTVDQVMLTSNDSKTTLILDLHRDDRKISVGNAKMYVTYNEGVFLSKDDINTNSSMKTIENVRGEGFHVCLLRKSQIVSNSVPVIDYAVLAQTISPVPQDSALQWNL